MTDGPRRDLVRAVIRWSGPDELQCRSKGTNSTCWKGPFESRFQNGIRLILRWLTAVFNRHESRLRRQRRVPEGPLRDLARALLRRSAPDELQFRRARWLSSAIAKFSIDSIARGKESCKRSGLWTFGGLACRRVSSSRKGGVFNPAVNTPGQTLPLALFYPRRPLLLTTPRRGVSQAGSKLCEVFQCGGIRSRSIQLASVASGRACRRGSWTAGSTGCTASA